MPSDVHWLWSKNIFLSPSLKSVTTKLTTKDKLLPRTDIKLYTLPMVLLKEKGWLRGERGRDCCGLYQITPPLLCQISTTCLVLTGRCSGFSLLLSIFPQGCTMQIRTHVSRLALCPASLPSTTLRLLSLFLNNRTTQRSPRPRLSHGAFQNLPSVRSHTSQPRSIHTLQRSWSFPKELIHGRSTEQTFQSFI